MSTFSDTSSSNSPRHHRHNSAISAISSSPEIMSLAISASIPPKIPIVNIQSKKNSADCAISVASTTSTVRFIDDLQLFLSKRGDDRYNDTQNGDTHNDKWPKHRRDGFNHSNINNAIHAIKLHKEFICKYYANEYNLIRNEPIELGHIVAIAIYTDLSRFCTEFRKTYLRIDDDKSTLNKEHHFHSLSALGQCIRSAPNDCTGDVSTSHRLLRRLVLLIIGGNTEDTCAADYAFGINHSYPHLAPKFSCIRDELIYNALKPLSFDAFEGLLIKAIKLHEHTVMRVYKKDLKCKYFNKEYMMIRNELIGKRHVLAIVAYTDRTDFCTAFRATYRRMNDEQKDSQVTQRHKELYFYARSLFEAIEFFGEEMGDKLNVFHGLNKVMHFNQFTAYFNQPIYTTKKIEIAQQFSNGSGIILQFRSGAKPFDATSKVPKYLAVSLASIYPTEDEPLFYGENVVFTIYNIIEASNNVSHREELKLLHIFQRMIQNEKILWNDSIYIFEPPKNNCIPNGTDMLDHLSGDKRILKQHELLPMHYKIQNENVMVSHLKSLMVYIHSTLWYTVPIFNRLDKETTYTLSMNKMNFMDALHDCIDGDDIKLIPINKEYSIWIVRIHENVDIGVLLRVNDNDHNEMEVMAIYLHRDDIQKQFEISQEHYHYLDEFESYIDELVIIDPDILETDDGLESDASESVYEDTDWEQWDDDESDEECDEKVDDVDVMHFRI